MHKLAISLATLALSSCSTIWLPAHSIEDERVCAPGIIVHGDSLQGILRVGTPRAELVWPDNRLLVCLPVRNVDIEPIRVVAEVRFLESGARGITQISRQTVMALSSMEGGQVELLSAGPGDFGFEVRLMWDK